VSQVLQETISNLYDGSDDQVGKLVQEALAQGMPPEEIAEDGLIAGMDQVGRDVKRGDLYVPVCLWPPGPRELAWQSCGLYYPRQVPPALAGT
jgi:methanogenic corrinoid protein MtbC1